MENEKKMENEKLNVENDEEIIKLSKNFLSAEKELKDSMSYLFQLEDNYGLRYADAPSGNILEYLNIEEVRYHTETNALPQYLLARQKLIQGLKTYPQNKIKVLKNNLDKKNKIKNELITTRQNYLDTLSECKKTDKPTEFLDTQLKLDAVSSELSKNLQEIQTLFAKIEYLESKVGRYDLYGELDELSSMYHGDSKDFIYKELIGRYINKLGDIIESDNPDIFRLYYQKIHILQLDKYLKLNDKLINMLKSDKISDNLKELAPPYDEIKTDLLEYGIEIEALGFGCHNSDVDEIPLSWALFEFFKVIDVYRDCPPPCELSKTIPQGLISMVENTMKKYGEDKHTIINKSGSFEFLPYISCPVEPSYDCDKKDELEYNKHSEEFDDMCYSFWVLVKVIHGVIKNFVYQKNNQTKTTTNQPEPDIKQIIVDCGFNAQGLNIGEIESRMEKLQLPVNPEHLKKILFELTQEKKLIFENNTYKIPPQIPQKIP